MSISLDLMFAVPGQTPASWRRSLDAAIALGVDHVSTYGLTVEAANALRSLAARASPAPFSMTRAKPNSTRSLWKRCGRRDTNNTRSAILRAPDIAVRTTATIGRTANTWVSAWAQRHIATGFAAFTPGRSMNTLPQRSRVSAIPSEAERLEGRRRAGEAIMLALRTAQGVGLSEFKERYGIDVMSDYSPVVTRFARTGLLERVGDNVRLTQHGRFVANDVCAAFLTAEPS